MARTEVVENDQRVVDFCSAFKKGRGQGLSAEPLEHQTVHGPVSHHGRKDTFAGDRRDQRRSVPMTTRDFVDDPLSFKAPTVEPCEVSFDVRFVQKHEAFGVNQRLRRLPDRPGCRDVRAVLLLGPERLFL